VPGMYRGKGAGRSGSDEFNESDGLDIIFSWKGGGGQAKVLTEIGSSSFATIVENSRHRDRNYE